MNTIKGLDRIIFIMALIATVPSFLAGMITTNEVLKTLTPEYIEWCKEYDAGVNGINKTLEMIAKMPKEYNYPPIWLKIAGGFAGSTVGFFIVLFSLKGFTRGIRRLSLWIIELQLHGFC